MEHEYHELHESFANAIHPHSCYLCNSCSTHIFHMIKIEHELPESPESFGIVIHPHSCYSSYSCSKYIFACSINTDKICVAA